MVSGPARRALEFARRLVFRCRHDEILLRASALAFSTVLSLMPLLAVIWYFVARTLREQGPATFRMIAELLPYREEAVTAALQSFLEQSESVSGAALIGFFVVSLMTFLSVQETLSRIFGVVRPPSLWRRLLAFALLLFWGPLLIGSAYGGLLVLGQSSTTLGRLLRDSTLLGWLPALATLLGLAMLFWRASLGRIKLRHAFAGSLVATVALELLKVGFRIYVVSATEVQRAVYGTLAIAVFFVLSVQIGWIILLASAEVAACLGLPTGADAQPLGGNAPRPLDGDRRPVAPRRASRLAPPGAARPRGRRALRPRRAALAIPAGTAGRPRLRRTAARGAPRLPPEGGTGADLDEGAARALRADPTPIPRTGPPSPPRSPACPPSCSEPGRPGSTTSPSPTSCARRRPRPPNPRPRPPRPSAADVRLDR